MKFYVKFAYGTNWASYNGTDKKQLVPKQ